MATLLVGRVSLRGARFACRSAFITTESKASTQLVKTERKDVETVPVKDIVKVNSISGVPDTQFQRLVRIYQRSRNQMQSGSHNTHKWTLEFDNQERWENPLMGWTSSGDPHSNTVLTFNTKEQAIAFAAENGYAYQVSKPQGSSWKRKSYGDNFSWDKKTRVSTK